MSHSTLPATNPQPDPAARGAMRRRLLRWFERHRRDLPWRRTADPYRIWISEVMLQQTQVAAVIGYYRRFIAELPSLRRLAAADEQQVLRLWEGLGYYRRARNLHAAARDIVAFHNGRMPGDRRTLEDLPGFGRYTAAAVASIAFDASEAIVEANTARLWARVFGLPGDVRQGRQRAALWRMAEWLVPRRGAGTFNQAAMELGALVCTPENPRCDECPLVRWCRAYRQGNCAAVGRLGRPKTIERVHEAYVAIRRGGKLLVRQNNNGERWAGLWDFPRFRLAADSCATPNGQLEYLAKATADQTGWSVSGLQRCLTLRHSVTRFSITLDCYVARGPTRRARREQSTLAARYSWIKPLELAAMPLSVTARKFAAALASGAAGGR